LSWLKHLALRVGVTFGIAVVVVLALIGSSPWSSSSAFAVSLDAGGPTPVATVADPAAPAVANPVPSTSAPVAALPTALGATVPPAVRQWNDLIVKYATRVGIDPNLVAAVMMTESQGNLNATSPMGAVGLMQVIGGSYDPETNISQGVQILAYDLQQFNGDLEYSLAAYNAGGGSVDQYQGIPPFLETQNYVFMVLNRFYLYSAN
jgi:soluble lytic murein transglycosylase-like protein